MRKPITHETDPGGSLAADRAFVVQFRTEPASDAERLCGRIEHMVSGEVRQFRSTEELLEFVLRMLARAAH